MQMIQWRSFRSVDNLEWYQTDREICFLSSFLFSQLENQWMIKRSSQTGSHEDMLTTALLQRMSFGCMVWVCVSAIELILLLLWGDILVDCSVLNHCCIHSMWAWEGWSRLSELCNHLYQGLRPLRSTHPFTIFTFCPQHRLLFKKKCISFVLSNPIQTGNLYMN